jgi:hypothetical protein
MIPRRLILHACVALSFGVDLALLLFGHDVRGVLESCVLGFVVGSLIVYGGLMMRFGTRASDIFLALWLPWRPWPKASDP